MQQGGFLAALAAKGENRRRGWPEPGKALYDLDTIKVALPTGIENR